MNPPQLSPEQAAIFVNVLTKLHRRKEEASIYQTVLEEAMKSLHCQAGTLYICDAKTASLVPVAAIGASIEKLKSLPFKFGLGVCGWVAQNGESLILNHPEQDKRFTDLYDRITGFKTQSMLCAHMTVRDECIGVIELFNRTDRDFFPEDLVLLNVLSQHMAIALENALLYQKVMQADALSYTILNSLPSGVVAINEDGRVIFANRKSVEILTLEEPVVGYPIDLIFKKHPAFLGILQVLQKTHSILVRHEIVIHYPQEARIGYGTIAIRTERGKPAGYGVIFQNITPYQK